MKRTLLCSLTVALAASMVSAGEGRPFRGAVPFSLAPALTGQTNSIPMPAPLAPVPDPAFNETTPSYSPPVYQPAPTNSYVPAPSINPGPGSYSVQAPVISEPTGLVIAGPAAEVYQNVKYRGVRNIAPGAIPTVVQVPDPCSRDACCKTCVNVQICVPPCDPQRVRVSRDGSRVRYDFGKYAVSVRTVGKHVVVHYED